MTQRIRLWKVAKDVVPEEIHNSKIGLEKRLEDWLVRDISMLDQDLLVVGQQVPTAYGGSIDLLCIDREGFLVVVELKQGRTPREVAAQALDYASWVKDLNTDDVEKIAKDYANIENTLQDALVDKFGAVPDDLCEHHRSIIVAEAIDDSTERIVRYLSELGVPINVVRMHAFKDSSGQEMLAQVFLVEPDIARDRARSLSNRRRYPTALEIQELADKNEIGELFRRLKEGVNRIFVYPGFDKTKARYRWKSKDNKLTLVLDVYAVSEEPGKMPFVIHATRCNDHLGIPIEKLRTMLPTNTKEYPDVRKWNYSSPEEKESAEGLKGTFCTHDEVDKFAAGLREAKERLSAD